MKTITFSNHKGGVGKTTSVHNLGVLLSKSGKKVLLVDLDPQASLTNAVGIEDSAGKSMADVFGANSHGSLNIEDILVNVGENLFIAPSDLSMANVEISLANRTGRENVLKKALADVSGYFDLAIIDCGPSLGLLTINGLVAADAVVIPCQPSILDLRGVSLFLDSVDAIHAELNPELKVLGILVTQYDQRYTHHRDAIETMQQAGLPVLPVMIGRSVKVAEASGAGMTIGEYEPRNPQAENYETLSNYFTQWMEEKL